MSLLRFFYSREEAIRAGKGLLKSCTLPSWRQVFLLFVATAFLVQSYTAQTHIHILAHSSGVASLTVSLESAKLPAKAKTERLPTRDHIPANDDPAKCPLCQAVGHAGQFVWPTSAIFILPQLAAAIVPVAAAIVRAAEPVSHNWQGRAPPRT